MLDTALTQAVLNSDWNALTPAQRKCLLAAVAAPRDAAGFIKPYLVHLNYKSALSKAMAPYLEWQHERWMWRVTPAAIELIEYVRGLDQLPNWRYLIHNGEEGVRSLLQTRDADLAASLTAQGWVFISESHFQVYARHLGPHRTRVVT